MTMEEKEPVTDAEAVDDTVIVEGAGTDGDPPMEDAAGPAGDEVVAEAMGEDAPERVEADDSVPDGAVLEGTYSAGALRLTGGGAVPTTTTGIHTDPVDSFKCAECGGDIDVKALVSFSSVTCPGCGTTASVPARLSNFLLLRLLGTGGMGGVYYARDEALGRFVAIKVMLQSLGDDPAFIETFRREAQAVAKLNHPHIAQIYSFGQEKGQPYIVMELVSGERVDAMMETPEGIRPALVMQIGLEIAQGLSAADEAGLVHGDIKPENILLDTKGRAKLVDFGLATVAHQAAGEGIWGTPYYIAPEKIRRQKVDARSDIYSLGATLYHMLTGKPPFEGETPVEVVKARLNLPPPDPRDLMPALPEVVSSTIKRMLAVERTERYPNYLSLISDLRKAVQELGSSEAVKTTQFGSGKSIRFKKKGGGASAPLASGPVPESPGRKLVFHTDSRRVATRKAAAKDAGGTGQGAGKPVLAVPALSPEAIQARKDRVRRRVRRTFGTLFTLLLLAGAVVVAGYVRLRRQEEIEQRSEVFALHRARTDALALHLSISNTVDRILVLADRGVVVEAEVQGSVERITGSRLVIAPEPVVAPPPPVEGEAPVADGAVPVEGEAPVADGAVPEDEGIVEPPPPAEPEPEPVVEHAVMAPARQALERLLQLSSLKQQSEDIREASSLHRDQILAATHSTRTAADVQSLKELDGQVDEMLSAARTALDTAVSRAGQVQLARTMFDRQLAAREAAEIEAQRRRDEVERLARERQEHEAKVAAELQQVQVDRLNVRGLFDENHFEGALATLRQNMENYTTSDGKAAIQVLVDRYTYLVRMKESLIEIIPSEPFPWGWGSGSTARDIEKADARGVYVKGVQRPYPWSEVTTPQMLKLVDFYLTSRTMHPRALRNMVFGAAIYCDKFGTAGRDRARTYGNRALDLRVTRDEYTRLLENGWH